MKQQTRMLVENILKIVLLYINGVYVCDSNPLTKKAIKLEDNQPLRAAGDNSIATSMCTHLA